MNVEKSAWTRRYRAGLRRWLLHGPPSRASAAERLGGQAADLGLEILDVADVHARAMNAAAPRDAAPGNATRERMERADTFFKAAIVPIEATHRAARNADRRIDRLTRAVQRRAEESSAAAERLRQAIALRQATEAGAEARRKRQDERLAEAQRRQMRLRHRMHDLLAQDERERQRMGDALRDEIAQALLAIHLGLLALNASGQGRAGNAVKTIAHAQRTLQEFAARGLLAGAPKVLV